MMAVKEHERIGGCLFCVGIAAGEMRGDKNGECDYIRNFWLVSCRASAVAATGAERSAKRTSLPWGLVRRAKLG